METEPNLGGKSTLNAPRVTEARKLLSVIEDGGPAPAAGAVGQTNVGSTVSALGKLPNSLAGGGNRLIKRKRQTKAENDVVEGRKKLNLDKMDADQLMELWNKSQTRAFARELFPELPKGYMRTTRNIGHLAANLATLEKNPRNIEYQRIAFDIWHRLPSWAKEILRVKFR